MYCQLTESERGLAELAGGDAGLKEREDEVALRGAIGQGHRLHREHASKTDVRIIDFVDAGHPALLRMWDKRQRGYRAMGYKVGPDGPAE